MNQAAFFWSLPMWGAWHNDLHLQTATRFTGLNFLLVLDVMLESSLRRLTVLSFKAPAPSQWLQNFSRSCSSRTLDLLYIRVRLYLPIIIPITRYPVPEAFVH